MSTNNFKLIAIRPLGNCGKRFLKNLSKGTIYKFYNEYKFYNSEGKEFDCGLDDVSKIEIDSKVPSNLYNNSNFNETQINVSALVGKNGSGKSSLLELLYASCYVIASRKQILKDTSYYREKFEENNYRGKHFLDKIREIESIYDDLNVEFFYQINDSIYGIRLEQFDTYHYLLKGHNDKFDDKGFYNDSELDGNLKYVLNEVFFYTISINYSLYGLNEKYLGDWVTQLFHKNDGYQTPLVINPYRIEGNINVNSELHLSQTRLLTNLIKNPKENISNGKQVDTVVFEIDSNKYNKEIDDNLDKFYSNFKKDYGFSDNDFATNVYNKLYGGGTYKNIKSLDVNTPHFEFQCKYIFRKIIKISQYYAEYKNKISIDEENKKVEFKNFFTFLSGLSGDRSHITLKLRQVLNNLRFNFLNDNEGIKWIVDENKKSKNSYYKIKLDTLINCLTNKNDGKFLYEELLPIGCFNTILWVKNGENNDTTNLDVLSSGEQHFIHSIQSILYHLSNLNSVFDSKANKIKYRYVNIVLDEIELYYHPEFQRIFLDELLTRIGCMSLPHIRGINILLCTHSPFILSDVPIENTLKLDNGEVVLSDKLNTLGANIHNLLDNDFYLDKGFMGEYIKKQIYDIIMFLEDKELESFKQWNKENSLKFINLIEEPLLKRALRDLYFEKYSDNIDAEIERLIELKKKNNDTDL